MPDRQGQEEGRRMVKTEVEALEGGRGVQDFSME